jgi:hypothetical protein
VARSVFRFTKEDTMHRFRLGVLAITAFVGAFAVSPSVAQAQATLSVSKAGNGSGRIVGPGIDCGRYSMNCRIDVPAGTRVTLYAQPAGGGNDVFTGWTGACAGRGQRCDLVVTGDVAATALFDARDQVSPRGSSSWRVSLSVSKAGNGSGSITGPGIDCGRYANNCRITVPNGTAVTLYANPAPGGNDLFSQWTGACSGSGLRCDLVLNGDAAVTAVFDARSQQRSQPQYQQRRPR